MIYLLVFFTSLIITIIITPLLLYIIESRLPAILGKQESVENKNINYLGGIIIFLSAIITLNAFTENFSDIKSLIIAAAILVFSGIIDDYIGIKKILRFILQNTAAIIFIIFLKNFYETVSIFGLILENPFDYLFLIVFITAIINALNIMNKLEGLASGFSLIVFSYLFMLSLLANNDFTMKLNLIMLGTSLGFVRYNKFSSKLKLGATGSMLLGLFILFSAFNISINHETKVLDLTFPLLLLGVPIVFLIKFFILFFSNRYEKYKLDINNLSNIITGGLTKNIGTLFLIEIFTLLFILISLAYYYNYKTYAIISFLISLIFTIGLKTFFSELDFANKLNLFSRYIHSISIKNLSKLKKSALIISGIIIISIIIVSYPLKTNLTERELLFLLIGITLLLVLQFFQISKNKSFNNIIIFLNLTIFFILTRLSLFTLQELDYDLSFYQFYHDFAYYLLSIILVASIIMRWKLEMSYELLFSETDVTLIIIMLLLFILNKAVGFDTNYYLSFSLLEAFIFYIWIKLVLDTKQELKIPLLVLSFLIPITAISTLII
ncbi:MAG: hypothetical protein CR986_07020 [Ignavibacteriae bacterium]|nr:MAG: hypothetical protein CR986_07020 [Ignavibacteriota bacterium]